ncbi:MAG: DUF5615 family PIN-like protein [Phycisphaeraceae bacterium]
MKILLDESAPHEIRHWLWDHEVHSVAFRGWTSMKNGELIAAAETEYDLLITSDQNMPDQQNIAARKLAVLVLPTNNVTALRDRIDDLRKALARCRPGRVEGMG